MKLLAPKKLRDRPAKLLIHLCLLKLPCRPSCITLKPMAAVNPPSTTHSVKASHVARMFGKRIGVKYAEGFISEKKIGIRNLDALIQNET